MNQEIIAKKRRSGFTLIELLTVVSVIGLLSSIVLVSFRGATDKARIAKGLAFSSSIQRSLGIECLGAWDFDDGAGVTAKDSMGFHNGTISGGASYSTDTPRGLGVNGQYSLSMDGVDDYVTVSGDLTQGLSAITVEAWAKGSQAANLVFATSNTVILHFRGAGFYLVAEDGTVSNYLGWTTAPVYDKWLHLVATWDGSKMALYQNGEPQTATRAWSGGTTGKLRSSTAFYIGRYFNSGQPYFKGQVDHVRVYGQALTLGQIKTNYMAGLERLLANGQITNEEYQQKISKLKVAVKTDSQ